MLFALLAAVLFGASAPLSKLLLQELQPVPLASLLYLGAGLGAALMRGIASISHPGGSGEAGLHAKDLPWLVGAVVAGGVLAPILLMISLKQTPASTASLLLNFESVATALLAGLVFREAIGRRIWAGLGCITLASIILSFTANDWGISLGALGVIGACILWGVDNNLIRQVSAKDPLAIVLIKGLGAGSFSLLLGLLTGAAFPRISLILIALLVGALSYGVSIALYVLALRSLGAARTGGLYATAPFVGAALSLVLLRENLEVQFLLSLPLILLGSVFLLGEKHSHEHTHLAIEHEHRHRHDDLYHNHTHSAELGDASTVHTHIHRHEAIVHAHAHTPDLHHWHEHGS